METRSITSLHILIHQHEWYNYADAGLVEGLLKLGHEVYATRTAGTNYVEKWAESRQKFDLFIECYPGQDFSSTVRSCLLWGEDHHRGLQAEFTKGYDQIFIRDKLLDEKGLPWNFSVEQRYFCAIPDAPKPLKDREIDICFLGDLAGYKTNRRPFIERLQKDFSNYNLMLGPRMFNEPDDYWSKWTRPWCAHDPRYFEALANSKVCLSFKGAGPDTGRLWECLASGAVCLVELLGTNMVEPKPYCLWFDDYDKLKSLIEWVLTDDTGTAQRLASKAWRFNRIHHSTAARAAYLLGKLGL